MFSFLTNFLRRQAESYLYESTLERFSTFRSDSNHTTREAIGKFFEGGASEDGMELWLDIFIIVSVLIIAISITNCVGRLCCWFTLRIPQQAKEIDDMRNGALPYQKEVSKKKTGKGKTNRIKDKQGKERGVEDSTDEENSREKDFHFISKAIGEMRQELKKTEKVLEVRNDKKNTAKQQKSNSSTGNKRTGDVHVEATFQRTNPSGKPPSPASIIRGVPSIQFVLSSPNDHYLVFSSHAKRKTYVIPQGRRLREGIPEYTGKKDDQEIELLSPSAFLSSGRDFIKNQHSYAVLEEFAPSLLPSSNRIEFYSAQFVPSTNNSVLVVGERNTDSFLICQLTGLCGVEMLQAYKMPGHRLVSSLSHWSVLCSSPHKSGGRTDVTWEGILSFQPKDAVVELFQRTSMTSSALNSPSGSFTCASTKLKVGSAGAWCYDRGILGVGGTFMREPRLCSLEVRTDKKNQEKIQVEPKPLITLGNASSGSSVTSFAGKLRVIATALVLPGLPASFNTRSYWILLFENGVGGIYNIEDYETPELVCTFTDTDFAGFTPDEPVTLLTAMQGGAYKERLILGLLQGRNLTVYHQAGFALPFEMVRRDDLCSAADGNYIEHACFLCGGKGVALCGREDSTGIRLFELTE